MRPPRDSETDIRPADATTKHRRNERGTLPPPNEAARHSEADIRSRFQASDRNHQNSVFAPICIIAGSGENHLKRRHVHAGSVYLFF